MSEGQWPQQDCIDDAEDCGGRSDTESKGQDCRQCETRRFAELANCKADVLYELIHWLFLTLGGLLMRCHSARPMPRESIRCLALRYRDHSFLCCAPQEFHVASFVGGWRISDEANFNVVAGDFFLLVLHPLASCAPALAAVDLPHRRMENDPHRLELCSSRVLQSGVLMSAFSAMANKTRCI